MVKANNKSNNNVVIILAATAVILVGAVGYNFSKDDAGSLYKNSPVVGKIDGKPVYQIEADQIVSAVIPPNNGKSVAFNDLDENSKTMIIREVAAQRAMLAEAKNKGIKEDDEMKRKVYEYKNKLIRDQVLSKFANTEITPETLAAKYAEVEKSIKGKTQIKVSHILLDTEEGAKKAEEALKKESFAKVAKEMSVDSSTKDKAGDIGYLITGTMDPDFEKAALALKQGEVSSPVKTKFGWHIIKLDDRKIASVAPFEALKGRIAQEIYTESLKKYADSLLTNAKVELVTVDVAKSDKKEEEKLSETKPAAGKPEVKSEAKDSKEEKKK